MKLTYGQQSKYGQQLDVPLQASTVDGPMNKKHHEIEHTMLVHEMQLTVTITSRGQEAIRHRIGVAPAQ